MATSRDSRTGLMNPYLARQAASIAAFAAFNVARVSRVGTLAGAAVASLIPRGQLWASSPKRLLVIGGTDFVGLAVVEAGEIAGYHVTLFSCCGIGDRAIQSCTSTPTANHTNYRDHGKPTIVPAECTCRS
jgi:hypothetical protein